MNGQNRGRRGQGKIADHQTTQPDLYHSIPFLPHGGTPIPPVVILTSGTVAAFIQAMQTTGTREYSFDIVDAPANIDDRIWNFGDGIPVSHELQSIHTYAGISTSEDGTQYEGPLSKILNRR